MLHDRILVLVNYVKDVLSGMFYLSLPPPPPLPTHVLILVQSQALHQKITLPYGPWSLWWLHSQLAIARVSEMSLKLCQYFIQAVSSITDDLR